MENNEEIINLLSELMIQYCQSPSFISERSEFLTSFITKALTSLSKQDEVSYSTSSILEIILVYTEKVGFLAGEADFYFQRVLRTFHHAISKVRNCAYKLVDSLLSNKTIVDTPSLKRIFVLAMQNVMIEFNQVRCIFDKII